MYLTEAEDFLTLFVDPGENAGWALACGPYLLSAGQTPLWPFADDVWRALNTGDSPLLDSALTVCADKHLKLLKLPIKRFVYENFRLYPDKAKSLAWDEFRTVRLIGALIFIARTLGQEIHDQPASIKTAAEVGGAEQFFLRPLNDNRHANDAIRHFWYFVQFGPAGNPSVPNRGSDD